MTKTKSTKRALLMSALAIVMCLSMLIGTTFAWFTDSVTSEGNRITAGKLEIALEKFDGSDWVDASTGPLFNYNKWEPGYTQIVNLRVVNKGTLALKWKAAITTQGALSKLADVINVYVRSDDANDTVRDYIATNVTRDNLNSLTAAGQLKKFTLRQFVEDLSVMTTGVLEENEDKAYLGLIVQMDTAAGNEYQELDLCGTFDLSILATQYTYEEDSFDKFYDDLAAFAGNGYGVIKPGESAAEVLVRDKTEAKIGSAVVNKASFAPGVKKVEVTIDESTYKPNITVAAGSETVTFDVDVKGLKENNDVPVEMQLRIAAGLDPATVKIYHYDTEIASTYNPNSGYVIFESKNFSPFTIVFDAESEYKPPVVDEDKYPTATVERASQYENAVLPWGSYGQWSPTEGLDAKLEAAYVFTCNQTPEQAEADPYANWYCDFYVKLNKDLGENEIFLGGNYGSFGWVGFHNGDVTLKANEEIPLLGSVTSNPWTYAQVANFVGTFTCGVGDVNNALSGATFTVSLRLTDPANENNTVDVAVINYTFQ